MEVQPINPEVRRWAKKALRLFWRHLEEGLAEAKADDVGYEQALPLLVNFALNLLPKERIDSSLLPEIEELIRQQLEEKLHTSKVAAIRNKKLITDPMIAKKLGLEVGSKLSQQLAYLKEDPEKLDEVLSKLIEFEINHGNVVPMHPMVKEDFASKVKEQVDRQLYKPANH